MTSSKRLLAVLAAALVLLAGCASDDQSPSSRPSASSAFPVKISHALGTTTIPAEPKRVVVVG